MLGKLPRSAFGLVFLLGLTGSLTAVEPGNPAGPSATKSRAGPDLSESRTVEHAVTTRISKSVAAATGQAGYLGIHAAPDPRGKLLVTEVAPDSPAAKA